MRVLLDTHVLLWWFFDDSALSQPARSTIANPANDVLVSSASAWEISTKHRLGKLDEAREVIRDLAGLLRRARFEVLPMGLEHALRAGALRSVHRDPFDRMLIAQSQLEGLVLVSADRMLTKHEVEILW